MGGDHHSHLLLAFEATESKTILVKVLLSQTQLLMTGAGPASAHD